MFTLVYWVISFYGTATGQVTGFKNIDLCHIAMGQLTSRSQPERGTINASVVEAACVPVTEETKRK